MFNIHQKRFLSQCNLFYEIFYDTFIEDIVKTSIAPFYQWLILLPRPSTSFMTVGKNLSWIQFVGKNVSWIQFVGKNVSWIQFVGKSVSWIQFVGKNVSWIQFVGKNVSWIHFRFIIGISGEHIYKAQYA